MIKIALVDDHELIRKGIAQMLQQHGMRIIAEASNGVELLAQLGEKSPDVVLMDISMPEMDGIEATQRLKETMPAVKVIALSVFDDDMNVLRMLRAGARGYLLKNARIMDVLKAINDVVTTGYHFSDLVNHHLILNLNSKEKDDSDPNILLNPRELEFIKLCCTELTYKEIADRMHVSPRTAEGYGKSLCEKLGLKSRVGLVLYAFKNHLYQESNQF